MKIIPAVDIKNGKCVRLLQGKLDQETVFSNDPSAMAKRWTDEGADLIHVVDLDGAVGKKPKNLPAIKKILNTVEADIQVGGGIRDKETVEMYIELGVSRVIIGTEAIRHPEMVVDLCGKFPGRIIVGIDAVDGSAAIEGWTEKTETGAVELARKFDGSGVAAIIFTDIDRDGMQTGPNIESTKQVAEAVSVPIIASGGVSNIDDIRRLLPLSPAGVSGVITGRALYSGTLDLREAIRIASGK